MLLADLKLKKRWNKRWRKERERERRRKEGRGGRKDIPFSEVATRL